MTAAPVSFVTGATGFVGAALARLLDSRGYNLRLLCRKNGDRRNLRGLERHEIVEGDLRNPSDYANRLSGCDALFHVAADYRIWVPDPYAMHAINVEGTDALMRAAHACGVSKIVYTSSVATLGIPANGAPGDETTPVTIKAMVGVYKRSKFMAEEIVRRLVLETGLRAVIVNPSTPIGPRDIKPTPTGRIILEAAKGRMPAYVDTGLNVAHVDDVAMGHILALEKGRIGERYVLGGEDLDLASILGIVASLTGGKPPHIKIPRMPLFPLALGAELVARATGKEPFITVDGLRMAKKKMFFSSEKAKRELGYAPRPAFEAIKDALDWFENEGYLA